MNCLDCNELRGRLSVCAAEKADLGAQLAASKKLNAEWFAENGPGGWIDNLRNQLATARNEALEEILGILEKSRREAVAMNNKNAEYWLRAMAVAIRAAKTETKP